MDNANEGTKKQRTQVLWEHPILDYSQVQRDTILLAYDALHGRCYTLFINAQNCIKQLISSTAEVHLAPPSNYN